MDARGLHGLTFKIPVSQKLFHSVDSHRFIHAAAGAFRFAGMKADTSGNGGKGIAFLQTFQRAAHIAALKHGLVSPDIRARRTGPHARGCFRLVGIQPEYVKPA